MANIIARLPLKKSDNPSLPDSALRCTEKVFYDDGTMRYRVYSTQNPHYYFDAEKNLQSIDLEIFENTVSGAGVQSLLNRKNISSLGVRKDGNLTKYMGLRPDVCQDGTEQLEFSIISVQSNGDNLPVILETPSIDNKHRAIKTGIVRVKGSRRGVRQMVQFPDTMTSFRIEYLIHVTGLRMEEINGEYWFYSNATGDFRYKIKQPKLVNASTFEPIWNDEDESDVRYEYVTHSLVDNHDGTMLYVKESTIDFELHRPSTPFLVDVDTVYSSTSDGRVRIVSQSTWNDAHDATTGDLCITSDTRHVDALTVGYDAGYEVTRSFFYFDVSALSGTVDSATIGIRGYLVSGQAVSIQLGTQGSSLSTADLDSFSGNYYDKVDSWSTSGYNVFTLNSQGESDLQNLIGSGIFKICARNYTYDYSDTSTTSLNKAGIYFANYTDTDHDPYIEITLSSFIPKIIIIG